MILKRTIELWILLKETKENLVCKSVVSSQPKIRSRIWNSIRQSRVEVKVSDLKVCPTMRLVAAGWLVDGLCRTISAILDIYCSRQRPTLIWMGAIENVTICKYLWRFPDIFDIVSRRGAAIQWLICVQIHTPAAESNYIIQTEHRHLISITTIE